MFHFRAKTLQSPEFLMTLLNNFFLPLGMLFFGWTFFESLFLFWLEPLAAIILLIYLRIIIPLKFDPPAARYRPEYQKSVVKTLALLLYTLVAAYISLVVIIDLGQASTWDSSQGIGATLSQLPYQLWQGNLLLLTILFLLMFLIPPIIIERKGYRPSDDRLPLQTLLLIYPWQFFTNFLWLGVLYIIANYVLNSPLVLICILAICKSIYETIIYLKLDWERF